MEELRQPGIEIPLAELLRKRRGPATTASPSASPAARRARLSAATEFTRQHGCALGTIMNLKRQAGLTRPREKKS